MRGIRGMSLQLLKLLLIAGICAALFFITVSMGSRYLINRCFTGSKLQLKMTEQRIESFRNYVSKNAVAATDSAGIHKWCDRQPMILMEVYRDDVLYFNLDYNPDESLSEQNISVIKHDWYSYYVVMFFDGPAEVFVYSDEDYILWSWVCIASLFVSAVIFTLIVLAGIRRTVRYIYLLCDEIQIIAGGDLNHPVTVKGNNELGMLAKELNHMRYAIIYHNQKEYEIIHQNNEMISCLSHDIRTPLTKLMLYADIIQNEKYEDREQLVRYIGQIREKCIQMKNISEHLLHYSLSKADSSDDINPDVEPFRSVFYDRIFELREYLSAKGCNVVCDVEWAEYMICIDELFIDRILDNIVSNIEKYAEKSCPVRIRSVYTGLYAGISFANVMSLSCSTQESSGIGLKSIHSMMLQMNGLSSVNKNEKEFEISLMFPVK